MGNALLSGVLPFLYQQGDRAKRYARGLLEDPAGTAEQAVGSLLDAHRAQQGLLSQAFADQRQPFKVTDRNALGQVAENMLAGPLGFAPAGITAWHGSPHIFDKFDSSKIGSGEGAQAYGRGLYLAESPKVAASYNTSYYRRPYDENDPYYFAKQVLDEWSGGSVREALSALTEIARKAPTKRNKMALGALRHNVDLDKVLNGESYLYKVDLPDDAIAKMLDWDKAMSQQAESVRTAARDLGLPVTATGRDVYNALTQQARDMAIMRGQNTQPTLGASQAGASADLRELGIPGIRYLDGGSRSAGGGTSNFVVFPGEENILSILERNGQTLR